MKAEAVSETEAVHDALRVAEAFVPLCSLKRQYLRYLLEQSSIDYLCAGQAIFERGSCDYRHIYLLHGHARLAYASGYDETIGARDHLYPLGNEMPRACDCIAESDCTILTIESDKLDRIVSWSQIAQYLLTELSAWRDLDEDINWIKTVVDSNLFFKVPPVNAEKILNKMRPVTVSAGETVIRQGEIGSCCYFIKEGQAEVWRHNEHGDDERLATIGPGRCFGEDSLVYETVRNASVRMSSDGVLMKLEKRDFKILLLEPVVDEIGESEVHQLMQPVFVDVRSEAEYDEGHLSLAANIPLGLLATKKRLLRSEAAYVFYCDTGRRSRAAAYLMARQGFNAMALRGGLLGAGMQYQLVSDDKYLLKDGKIAPDNP